MKGLPDLSALEDLPEKTQEMQDSLHRIEALLRMLIDVQVHALYPSSESVAQRYRDELADKHGVDF
jgi:hypothetical protein